MAVVFESTTIDEIEAFLSETYTRVNLSGLNGVPTRTRIARTFLPGLTSDEFQLGADLTYRADPLDNYILCSLRSGGVEIPEYSAGPGDVLLLPPGERGLTGRLRHPRELVLMLDPTVLQRVAATALEGRRPAALSFHGHRPATTAARRQLRDAIDYVHTQTLTNPALFSEPLISTTITQFLAAMVLATVPNNTSTDPNTESRRDAHPATLRRAISYIEVNPHRDLTIADIATAAGVTNRAIQLAFRRHLDTTPLAYLRQVRLAQAHADLQAADPTQTTVTAIAAHWGFHHPGRFANQYRTAYGQSPSTTLNS
ncbi:helix-turn-helix domain-containing protein [Kribbella pittospori]|uniref:Helix-turn-helix domain-containing protein n=1 Tax=Kribbella pittospori TaxID=722689 RepID=A0A4R0KA89_9ACTN|nr:helix-turn-helix domain-containing protein [Kribbella pittospori]TCC54878.1 helix-turn-helix domain-containing protein [Kribbella pittospori]